ncbi:MAG: DUF3500 domain-containing protein [Balneolaceae bacterium]|nr:DUF3500 domain-containing protein [Balneolaceae bacterium]
MESPAVNFLNSLDQDQRAATQFSFDDTTKTFWHFIPGSFLPRSGIQLAELNPVQKEQFTILLQSYLSETGYVKTQKIIDLENVLAEMSGDSVMRDPEKYFISFYGDPGTDSLWAWSFEGHHLSLNFSILNGKATVAPRFLGASPARIPAGPREGERTLDKEEDLGFQLIQSMDDSQRTRAIFQLEPFSGFATGNASEVEPLKDFGIQVSELNRDQQVIFFDLLGEYLSTLPPEQAESRMNRIRNEEMNELMFGWSGAMTKGIGHYYRIQGRSFLIEFDNTQGNSNHIHTVWRDFDGDFGRDLIREHYQYSDHHNN